MKSMFLKAAKVVALSLVLTLGASSMVFANGGGTSPTRSRTAHNGGGNGAGSKTGKRRHHRVTRRHRKG
ncbi:MAG: hypothetical protein QOC96_3282 [Acidobacteriota bacterium]|jgi:hypothetical protein|nr:hypothetical protein [Acidobacteriota bacterium]